MTLDGVARTAQKPSTTQAVLVRAVGTHMESVFLIPMAPTSAFVSLVGWELVVRPLDAHLMSAFTARVTAKAIACATQAGGAAHATSRSVRTGVPCTVYAL